MNQSQGHVELNRRILIVDDNRAIHNDVQKILGGGSGLDAELEADEEILFGAEAVPAQTFQIDSAFQGQEGLEKVKTALAEGRPYAMAFVDIRMPPGWDGIETVGHLWEHDPRLQVVLCTAYSDYSWNDMRRKLGSPDSLLILKKPFDNIEVIQLVHALTRKWTVSREAEEQTARLERELASKAVVERDLRASQERYTLAARGANDGIWDWDLVSLAICLTPRWKEMLGFSEDEIAASPEEWMSRVHPDDRGRFRAQLEACVSDGGPDEFISESRVLHKDGTYRWMLSRAGILRSPDGKALRIAGSQTDVTRNKAFDALTALPNRVLFVESLARAIELRKAGSIPSFGVMFIDLDGFKDINDSLGHPAGDRLLVEVARRIELTIRTDSERGRRATDLAARFGGDEFAILIGDVSDPDRAGAMAQRIEACLRNPVLLGGRTISPTASIGIALWTPDYTAPDEMLRDADTAMYRAKRLGRARATVFDDSMRAEMMGRIEMENDLRVAVENGGLHVEYQPIFELSASSSGSSNHRIAGFEALARWRHAGRGLVSPGQFIPIAEDTGLIVPLGEYVLREACHAVREWQTRYPEKGPLSLSVNLSPRQLRDPNLATRVAAILKQTDFEPSHLRLEITESVLVDETPTVAETLASLREMGIALEIDDFGTGYSCLSYLTRLHCRTLKIDRSFVMKMLDEVHSLEVVRAILALAQNLNMKVIAEGIETQTQLDLLRNFGCRFGQGFYLSRPLSPEAALRLVQTDAAQRLPPSERIAPIGLPAPTLASPGAGFEVPETSMRLVAG